MWNARGWTRRETVLVHIAICAVFSDELFSCSRRIIRSRYHWWR